MDDNIRKVGKLTVRVVTPDKKTSDEISPEDQEMDKKVIELWMKRKES